VKETPNIVVGVRLIADSDLGSCRPRVGTRPDLVMTSGAQVCWRCENQPGHGGRWALIDPSTAAQVTADQVQPRRLQLVVVPPAVRAGVGLIQLRWGATIYGQVELALCAVDRRGVLLGLHVEPRHRRRGVGRVLARAAAARDGGFSWSANPPHEPDAAAFWAKVGAPRAPASLCSHQEAAGLTIEPRWPKWW
jgi:GNAT superfamily N-acetyltransferase